MRETERWGQNAIRRANNTEEDTTEPGNKLVSDSHIPSVQSSLRRHIITLNNIRPTANNFFIKIKVKKVISSQNTTIAAQLHLSSGCIHKKKQKMKK
jgi:hypothetical protein